MMLRSDYISHWKKDTTPPSKVGSRSRVLISNQHMYQYPTHMTSLESRAMPRIPCQTLFLAQIPATRKRLIGDPMSPHAQHLRATFNSFAPTNCFTSLSLSFACQYSVGLSDSWAIEARGTFSSIHIRSPMYRKVSKGVLWIVAEKIRSLRSLFSLPIFHLPPSEVYVQPHTAADLDKQRKKTLELGHPRIPVCVFPLSSFAPPLPPPLHHPSNPAAVIESMQDMTQHKAEIPL